MIQNSPGGGAIDRSSLNATVGRMAAIATALLLVAFLVLSVSRAAFTASTASENNYVETGGFVELIDNDGGSARFDLTDATPNEVTTRCINVRLVGTASTPPVKMFAELLPDPNLPDPALGNLDQYLDVTVVAVDATALDNPTNALLFDDFDEDALVLGDCSLFDAAELANTPTTIYGGATLQAFPSTYTAGPTAFTPADGRTDVNTTYAFKISVEVQDVAAAADARSDWNFVWATGDV